MTQITCKLDQPRNRTLGNRVWATFLPIVSGVYATLCDWPATRYEFSPRRTAKAALRILRDVLLLLVVDPHLSVWLDYRDIRMKLLTIIQQVCVESLPSLST